MALVNGSFESGSYDPAGTPDGWSKSAWDTGGASFTWDNTSAVSGTKSARIDASASNDAYWSQPVSVQPNTNYILSGWIRTQDVAGGAGASFGLFGRWDHSAGLFGTNDWTYVTFPFNSGSDNVVYPAARIGHWGATSTGTVWFDDIRVDRPINWKILVLIYGTTDFTYSDGSGSHHVVGTLTAGQQTTAANAASRFASVDVPALSSGYQSPQLTVRYPSHALSQLDAFCGYWPSPSSTAADRDPTFDSVIVVWQDYATDVNTGTSGHLNNCGGLTVPQGTGQTYTAFTPVWLSDTQENIFKHEWGHAITYYYASAGTAPSPAVNNHINDTDNQYVHCQTGAAYSLQEDPPDPNTVYNNAYGFTHDYYSGTTARPDHPRTCLGITAAAWASGGPVTRP